MKRIGYIMLCILVQWHLSAQNLQVIPQWASRQVDTNGNTRVVSSIGAMTSVSDIENGVILTTFLLQAEEVEDTTGIISLEDKIGLRVYPNPTPDVINLSRHALADDLWVTITDPSGKLIRTVDWPAGIMVLQLYVQSASGYYIIHVTDVQRSARSTFKVLKP